jgi:hypothetical protein
MVMALVRRLPGELLPTDSGSLTTFVAATGAIEGALDVWSGGGHPNLAPQLSPSALFGGQHPLVALLRVLRACPDEAAIPVSPMLTFIGNDGAREDIQIDRSMAHKALGNAEYKAAAVISGAVIEALLLWSILAAQPNDLTKAITSFQSQGPNGRVAKGDPLRWVLAEYIGVAHHLNVIDSVGVQILEIAKDFRNFIHPGRVQRAGERPSQATAHLAVGAMEFAASAVEKWALKNAATLSPI